jgi:hypothetical protein
VTQFPLVFPAFARGRRPARRAFDEIEVVDQEPTWVEFTPGEAEIANSRVTASCVARYALRASEKINELVSDVANQRRVKAKFLELPRHTVVVEWTSEHHVTEIKKKWQVNARGEGRMAHKNVIQAGADERSPRHDLASSTKDQG